MGGELAKTFRLLFYYGIKKTFEKGPNNLIADLNLSIYSENHPPLQFSFMWELTASKTIFFVSKTLI
jgi:hypothetical protein